MAEVLIGGMSGVSRIEFKVVGMKLEYKANGDTGSYTIPDNWTRATGSIRVKADNKEISRFSGSAVVGTSPDKGIDVYADVEEAAPPPSPPPPEQRRIYGEVIDSVTGSSMSFVSVVFSGRTSTTDASGNYEILDPEFVSGPITAKKFGYQDYESFITAPVEGGLEHNIVMNAEPPAPPVTEAKQRWERFQANPDIISFLGTLPDTTLNAFSRVFSGYDIFEDREIPPEPGHYLSVALIIVGLTLAAAASVYAIMAELGIIGAAAAETKAAETITVSVQDFVAKIIANPTGMVSQVLAQSKPFQGYIMNGLQQSIAGRAALSVLIREGANLSRWPSWIAWIRNPQILAIVGSVAGLMGINAWAAWAATDNVGTLTTMTAREAIQRAERGEISLEDTRRTFDVQKGFLAAAAAFMEASRWNPLVSLFLPTFNLAMDTSVATFSDLEARLVALEAEPPKTTLTINSVPSGAGVEITGLMSGVSPLTVDPIDPGIWGVRVWKEGYVDLEKSVEVRVGRTNTEDFFLKSLTPPELFGTIAVTTSPEGADIYINDTLYPFPSNSVVEDLEPGTYVVKVERSGYASQERVVDVRLGEQTDASFTLSPKVDVGSLEVVTVPSGADVYLNEELYQYKTNTVIEDLAPGDFTVRVEKTGYDPHFETVGVAAGVVSRFSWDFAAEVVPPEELQGTMRITTNPGNVDVFSAGMLLGRTGDDGIATVDADPGTYLLDFRKEGYRDTSRTAIVKTGQETAISLALTPEVVVTKLWRIDVEAKDPAGMPLNAKILINGSFTDKWTPDYVLLLPGSYTVRLEKSGYLPAEQDIELEAIM